MEEGERYTLEEAAARSGLSVDEIWDRLERGELSAVVYAKSDGVPLSPVPGRAAGDTSRPVRAWSAERDLAVEGRWMICPDRPQKSTWWLHRLRKDLGQLLRIGLSP